MKTREMMELAIRAMVADGCEVGEFKAYINTPNTYDEEVIPTPIIIKSIDSTGSIVGESDEGVDEYFIYELTGDSLMKLLDKLCNNE